MAWFKVDDKLWGHPKWLMSPPRARGLWVTAGSWSASNETDGLVPTHVIATLGGTRGDANALVKSGLWITDELGYRFHGWADFQPTKADLDARRDADRERKAEWRAKRAGHAAVTDESQRDTGVRHAGVTAESRLTRPDPTRPDPISSSHLGNEGGSKRRASEHPEQACGRRHDPADSCGACGAARRRDAKTDADALAAKRAREQAQRDAKAKRTAAGIANCGACDDRGYLPGGKACPTNDDGSHHYATEVHA